MCLIHTVALKGEVVFYIRPIYQVSADSAESTLKLETFVNSTSKGTVKESYKFTPEYYECRDALYEDIM